MVNISQAQTHEQLEAVRHLMRAFIEWHYHRHHESRDLIDRYFDPVKFDNELADLPGDFAPPRGRLLVATDGENVAGCVALHDLGDDVCEMKRMFVHSAFHGQGVGLALGEAIILEAKTIGYHSMRLDTGPKQNEAQGLYRRLGFEPIPAYYELDDEMKNWLIFMQRSMTDD
jgi:GNAT superfamily N-acetyltransferase